MSKSKHNEAQIIEAVKQLEAGQKAEDLARGLGVSKLRSMRGRLNTAG